MLQYDSVHGRFKGEVSVSGNTLSVNGKKIRLTQERDPANLKWADVGAQVVIESTGLFLDKATAEKHLTAGAKKVIMSAPSKDDYPDVCLWRQRQKLCRASHHQQCQLHHQLPGPSGQGAQRQMGHQARPHDHGARGDGHPENGGWPQQQGLARWPWHSGKHHPLLHRCRQGCGRSHSRAETRN